MINWGLMTQGGPTAPSAEDPLVGRVLSDRYRILRKLGEGGMGAVYLAEHTVIEKKIALKVLFADLTRRPDLVQRFLQEAKSASRIGHPNVIDITDFGQSPDGSAYIAMEYLDGQDLGQLLKGAGPIPWPTAQSIMLQVTKGLRAAHEKGIVHRDVKPENIFLSTGDDGAVLVKVLDFGIAKVLGTEEGAPRLTRTGMIFGTPEYMSPEQAQGQSVDHRVDIYAVGCILYQLVTGAVPFEAESFMGVLSKHMLEAPVAPRARNPAVDPAVESVVLKAMEKNPARRFQTMRELVEALTQLGPPSPELSGPIASVSMSAPGTRPLLAGAQPPAAVTRPLGASPPAAGRPGPRPTEPLWTPPKALPTLPERMPLSPSNPEVRASETEIIAPSDGDSSRTFGAGRSRRRVWPLLAAVGALGVVAGLAAWLLAGGAGSSPSSPTGSSLSGSSPTGSSPPSTLPAGEGTVPRRPSASVGQVPQARTAQPASAVALPPPVAPRKTAPGDGHADDVAGVGRKSRPAPRRAAAGGDDSRAGTSGATVTTPPELKNPFAPSVPAGRTP